MRLLGSLIVLCAATTGCAGYRLVERTPSGGTYALVGNQEDAMVEARPEMEAHCKGPVEIVREGEVVVGERVQTQAGTRRRGNATYGVATTETSQNKEWRVDYRCTDASAPGAPSPTSVMSGAGQSR